MDIQRSHTNNNLTLQILEAENVHIYQAENNNEFGMVDELYFYVQLCIREVDDTSNLKFFLEKSELSSAENVYISLGFYLDQHGLSVADQEEIQHRISSFARSISFNGRACIPIYIEVRIFVEQLQVQFDDDESSFGTGPAAESAIRALEKFKLKREGDYVQLCAICQEEFMVGTEVTALPCSHIYHGDCIVKWLKTRHFCPLCRFEMPSTCSQA